MLLVGSRLAVYRMAVVIGTIGSYQWAMHTDFFWNCRAINDIAHLTSYRDAIGVPCIRALGPYA